MNYFLIFTRNLYKFYTNITNIKPTYKTQDFDQFYYGFGWMKRKY